MTPTTRKIPVMVDLVFELGGESPSASYPFSLWEELKRLAPLLAEQTDVGMLPLRLPGDAGMLLPRRTKLAIRLPEEIADQVAELLAGQLLIVEGRRLLLGKAKKRPIQHYPTIHAPIVAGVSDEVRFMADIAAQLKELGVTGNLICGRHHILSSDKQRIEGYSLVIHDLKSDASLKLQYAGLGDFRKFGCGVFIPYKVISGLDDD